jgi:hypothetical protein
VILSSLPDEVAILTPGASTDGYGDSVEDWGAASETIVSGWLRPSSSDETEGQERSAIANTFRLDLEEAAPDLTGRERIRVSGVLYEVSGVPFRYRSPFGGLGRVLVTLKRWEG